MKMKRHCVLAAAAVLLGFAQLAAAYDFYVGGAKGWAVKPEESYSVWAKNMRFQVNDKLVFKYQKGEDSVLLVKKEDFNSCNTNNPIKKFDDGNSVFLLNRSGPFFFISGAPGHCDKGQKLEVVVMAVRKKPAPPPASSPPFPSPASPSSPTPSTAPSSPHSTAFSTLCWGMLVVLLGMTILG
ncbi:Early nodulin-like protein 1 [Platanthera zijinensis]|uniref:Early nodulin-like protein 1 n=1 Tax=Platanthera zijinensis TaxID=2320716 RepID=A0AAP0B9Y3_9ASPA